MKSSLKTWQRGGFLVTAILGVLLHFLFEWSGECLLFAPFSAVNESIWEHMKLLFVPMFLFAHFESRHFGTEYQNFWCVKLYGILFGLLLIPTLYYTIGGIFGSAPDWVNIAIFFIAAALSYRLEMHLFSQNMPCKSPKAAQTILWFFALLFVIFTFFPPHIPLFQDPQDNSYGVSLLQSTEKNGYDKSHSHF